jgi:3-oxoacyl-[acyl-carrier-protein] synthase I
MDRNTLTSLGAVAVAGIGAHTALGTDAQSTFAALRAGLGRFGECAFLRSRRSGGPITVALAAELDPRKPLIARLRELASGAAREALRMMPAPSAGRSLGMVLAMAQDRPGLDATAKRQVAQAVVSDLTGYPISRPHCRVVGSAHDGGMAGLAQAAQWLNTGKIGACLVGGVESCVNLAFLDWLDEHDRLKARDRPFGHTPGEAAAFLLLVPAASIANVARDGVARAWIASVSLATEPSPWYSGRPTLAQGLTQAIAGLFAKPSLRALRTDVVYSDLNGEPWRIDEWSAAYLRTADNQGEPLHLRHPADCWGDVGAASAPLLAAMASLEVVHPRMRSRSALVWTASDVNPGRAAGLVVCEKGVV